MRESISQLALLAITVVLGGACRRATDASQARLRENASVRLEAVRSWLASDGSSEEGFARARDIAVTDRDGTRSLIDRTLRTGDESAVTQALRLVRSIRIHTPGRAPSRLASPEALLDALERPLAQRIRRRAASCLSVEAGLGPALASRMLRVLADDDRHVACEAVGYFQRRPPDLRSRDALLKIVRAGRSDTLSRQAAMLLARFADPSIIPILREYDASLGLEGAIARAGLGDDTAKDAVLRMIDRPYSGYAIADRATRALGALSDAKTGKALMCYLVNRDYDVRLAAIEALVRRRMRDAVPYMIPLLESGARVFVCDGPQPPKLRDKALEALRALSGRHDLTSADEWREWHRRECGRALPSNDTLYLGLVPTDDGFDTEHRFLLRFLGSEFSGEHARAQLAELCADRLETLSRIALDEGTSLSREALPVIESIAKGGNDEAWDVFRKVMSWKPTVLAYPGNFKFNMTRAMEILARNGHDPLRIIKDLIESEGAHRTRGLYLLGYLKTAPPPGERFGRADVRAFAILDAHLDSPGRDVRLFAFIALRELFKVYLREEYGYEHKEIPEPLPRTWTPELLRQWVRNYGPVRSRHAPDAGSDPQR
jgi:hypothetical protein